MKDPEGSGWHGNANRQFVVALRVEHGLHSGMGHTRALYNRFFRCVHGADVEAAAGSCVGRRSRHAPIFSQKLRVLWGTSVVFREGDKYFTVRYLSVAAGLECLHSPGASLATAKVQSNTS